MTKDEIEELRVKLWKLYTDIRIARSATYYANTCGDAAKAILSLQKDLQQARNRLEDAQIEIRNLGNEGIRTIEAFPAVLTNSGGQ